MMETHEKYDAMMNVDASTWQLFQHAHDVDTYNTQPMIVTRRHNSKVRWMQIDRLCRRLLIYSPLPCRRNFVEMSYSVSEIIIEILCEALNTFDTSADTVNGNSNIISDTFPGEQTLTAIVDKMKMAFHAL